jgi:hypothetical protein
MEDVPENCHLFDMLISFNTHPRANADFWPQTLL